MNGMQVCNFCVMDNSVAALEFDAQGKCDSCRDAAVRLAQGYFPDQRGADLLNALIHQLKSDGKGKAYDCMVGLSGGVDSAYLAHLMHVEYGLRVLAVHVDGGWNSEPAVRNIEVLVRALGIDLHTVVIEWTEMRDLQLAFLKSGTLNQDIPQDHAFFATLYKTARDFKIGTFISGVNLATESVQQRNGGHPSIDGRHLRAVHKKFGRVKLTNFPVMTLPQYLFQTRVLKRPRIVCPLNWINYNKADAINLLEQKYGWRDYGVKHAESRFTKFYQEVLLPRKIGFDKRRLHLSGLIVSGQISRNDALEALRSPIIDAANTRRDIRFVAKKLGVSIKELELLIDKPIVSHGEYASDMWLFETLHGLRNFIFRVNSRRRSPI